MKKTPDPDQRSPEETERRSRATLKNLIGMAPKRHDDQKAELKNKRDAKKLAEKLAARDPWRRRQEWP